MGHRPDLPTASQLKMVPLAKGQAVYLQIDRDRSRRAIIQDS